MRLMSGTRYKRVQIGTISRQAEPPNSMDVNLFTCTSFFTDLEPEIECHGMLRSWLMNFSGDVRICWHTRCRRMAGERVDV